MWPRDRGGRVAVAEVRRRTLRLPYHLTESGLALRPVLAALTQWGDEYRPSGFGPAALYRDRETGEPVRIAFVTRDGQLVADSDAEVVRGPGSHAARG